MVENRGGHFLVCGISRAFRGMRCSNGRCYYAFWIAVVSWGRGGGFHTGYDTVKEEEAKTR